VSDPNDQNISEEDERLLELLDRLAPESEPPDQTTLEAIGSMPFALDEVTPRPGVKDSLLEALSGASAPLPFAPPEVDSARLEQLERRARWFMPIAAALAVALLGLAGWQLRQLGEQRETIAALSAQLESMESGGTELELARYRLREMREQMAMLTARGTEFCVLKPPGPEPSYPGATATMVVSSDRSRWFLAAEGLEPCAKGRSYQLWLITDGEPIRVAVFDGEASGGRVELSGEGDVPTTVRAVTVTLEAEPEPAEPSEPILIADQAMTLL
jgi:hypothetical protein